MITVLALLGMCHHYHYSSSLFILCKTSITFVKSPFIFMSAYQLFCFTVLIVCHIQECWDFLSQHFDELPVKFCSFLPIFYVQKLPDYI